MTYPFAGTIKMELIQDDNGEPLMTWQEVNITYHRDGDVGIGTPSQVKWDASEPLVMGAPVERMRVRESSDAFVFSHPATEWARVDKDNNVTHLDMELCAKGPHNAYTALALAIWNKAIEAAASKAYGVGDEGLHAQILELKK